MARIFLIALFCVLLASCGSSAAPTTTLAPIHIQPTPTTLSQLAPTIAPTLTPSLATTAAITLSEGFAQPESMLHNQLSDLYLVSNINGTPFGRDDNGYISLVNPDGTLKQAKWIDGASAEFELNAPKGMAIANNTLYVADLDTVRLFDPVSGVLKGTIAISGSSFLNDLVARADGTVFVSDMGVNEDFSSTRTAAIYQIDAAGNVALAVKLDAGNPNGLAIAADGTLLVCRYDTAVEIFALAADGTLQPYRKASASQHDGLVALADQSLLVSSWQTASVHQLMADGSERIVYVGTTGAPADINVDAQRGGLLMPMIVTSQVVLWPLAD
ncbi:SMP-30/gluconolactonase/LRE family protein [Herpetosiphon llansteffanensis]|uniref:SMP-30/gluconolactonase/LRE family protein n=1 Tax=Herpetosiphon llansteffanensis TaxID=2094568 RepID=UPI000D7D1959|nr:SMP-30/gluconolactonase/LRE family protein [Herpetosiphon llansteffanensis]